MFSFEYANDCRASYYSYCLSVCLLVFNEANTLSSGSPLHRNHDSSCTAAARQPVKKLSENTLWSFSFLSPLMFPEVCLCLRPRRSELEQSDEGSDDERQHLQASAMQPRLTFVSFFVWMPQCFVWVGEHTTHQPGDRINTVASLREIWRNARLCFWRNMWLRPSHNNSLCFSFMARSWKSSSSVFICVPPRSFKLTRTSFFKTIFPLISGSTGCFSCALRSSWRSADGWDATAKDNTVISQYSSSYLIKTKRFLTSFCRCPFKLAIKKS